MVQEHEDSIKLNETHLLLVFADDVNLLDENIYSMNKKV
jgi:hypothetical protein